MAKRMHREEGFTLIELMIVILIIGILVGIAVPVFLSATSAAEKRSCQSNMRSWLSAVDICASDEGGYPGSEADWGLLNGGSKYFEGDLPVCPADGTIATATWTDPVSGNPTRPTINCTLHGEPGSD